MPVTIIKDYDNKAPSPEAFTPVKDQNGDYQPSIDFARKMIHRNLSKAMPKLLTFRVTSHAMFNHFSNFEGLDNVTVETV